ncbi:MAG: hypothetical protein ACOCUI_02405 [bacterium]
MNNMLQESLHSSLEVPDVTLYTGIYSIDNAHMISGPVIAYVDRNEAVSAQDYFSLMDIIYDTALEKNYGQDKNIIRHLDLIKKAMQKDMPGLNNDMDLDLENIPDSGYHLAFSPELTIDEYKGRQFTKPYQGIGLIIQKLDFEMR